MGSEREEGMGERTSRSLALIFLYRRPFSIIWSPTGLPLLTFWALYSVQTVLGRRLGSSKRAIWRRDRILAFRIWASVFFFTWRLGAGFFAGFLVGFFFFAAGFFFFGAGFLGAAGLRVDSLAGLLAGFLGRAAVA